MPAVLYAIALLLALAAPPARAATEITFYFPIAVGGPVAKTMTRLVEDFERAHPDIKVKPAYTGTYRESLAKALTAHRSGNPPDVAVLFAVDIYTLIDAEAIVPFDDLLDPKSRAEWLSSFYPAFMANSRAAGKTWGIPFQRSTILLYWNKKMFREAGLDPNRAPKDWDEMARYAKRLTQRDDAGKVTRWGLMIPSSGFPYWLFQGLVTANGGSLVNATGTKTSFDQPAVVDALQFWVDLSRRDNAHPAGIVEWGTTPTQFADGNAAMIWTTSGNFRDLRGKVGDDLGVAMLPAKVQRGSPTGGGNFYIFRRSAPDKQRAALEFVRWMVSPERTAQWSIDSGYIAVSPKAWDTPAMKAHLAMFPQAAVARDQLPVAVQELSTHENQRVTRALNTGLAAALNGGKTPAQAMKDAQAEAMRILLPYQR